MTERLILTVTGSDRPGLTQALADAVLAAEGNWLESRLARLGGRYVGAVLVEVASGKRAVLEAGCRTVDAAGLTVTLTDADARAGSTGGTAVTLDLIGGDRPGIVREISAALAALAVNIDELETGLQAGAESGAPLFRLTASLRVPAGVSLDQVRDALERLSGEIMVDFNLTRPLD